MKEAIVESIEIGGELISFTILTPANCLNEYWKKGKSYELKKIRFPDGSIIEMDESL